VAALAPSIPIAVVGAGTMGAGIAQVAASAGHTVLIHDSRAEATARALQSVALALERASAKGRISRDDAAGIVGRLVRSDDLAMLSPAGLVIEAVSEDMAVKTAILVELERLVAADAILASNTSSLSITALGSALERPERLVGMHFFNPAPVMPLVEVISGLATDRAVAERTFDTAAAWGKSPVHVKSTPGFLANRVARPFYGEALRTLEEGAADIATIDAVMRESGGFPMGPFELIDLVGVDVNWAVTNAVHDAYFQDTRFKPFLIQGELVAAGRLGRKSGRGFYHHGTGAERPLPRSAPEAPAPVRVTLEGDLGPAQPLVQRIELAGIPVRRLPGEGALVIEGARLALTDGRSATERAAAAGVPGLVLFDLVLDYGAVGRLAVAAADQAPPTATAAAAGLFHALRVVPSPVDDIPGLIVMRTVAMLANFAADAVHNGIADAQGVDTAMRKGMNYRRGPLAWAEAIGLPLVVRVLDNLARAYGEERYRASPLLRRRAAAGARFHG